jgi:hypothetical protein
VVSLWISLADFIAVVTFFYNHKADNISAVNFYFSLAICAKVVA